MTETNKAQSSRIFFILKFDPILYGNVQTKRDY